eukprot:CAMPEP_0119569386 /NCGR_PEP_ID=MMETSP1352-20130426/41459_1 /TAXON_ID=265584 /ORGANISM="Stauroneis constricta, Strain CCMP1120" /LENGTH=311 /DNA_ID=CAMNT_0007618927 /DNA_START=161 /DNA_END=1093 /DNA_ORIENTATION=-
MNQSQSSSLSSLSSSLSFNIDIVTNSLLSLGNEINSKSPTLGALIIPAVIATCFIVPATVILEYIVRQPWARKYYIQYNDKPRWGSSHHDSDRATKNDDTTADSSSTSTSKKMNAKHLAPTMLHDDDLMDAVTTVLAVAIMGPIALYILGVQDFLLWENVTDVSELSVISFLFDCFVYFVFMDLLSWTSHYACHHNDFLWKHVHAQHHTKHTPTALTAGVGNFLGPILSVSLPNVVAIWVLEPHALVMYATMCFYTVLTIYAHSGMSIPALNFAFGGFIPFRATPVLHDRHHRFSGRDATDMGFMFWIWDW